MSIEKGAWAGLVGDFEREERRKRVFQVATSCKIYREREREMNA